jgi:hypothetical protein
VRLAVSRCGPLHRAWRSAAFLRRVAASGPLSKCLDCWRPPAALSRQSPSLTNHIERSVRRLANQPIFRRYWHQGRRLFGEARDLLGRPLADRVKGLGL